MITLTERAAFQLRQLMEQRDAPHAGIRVRVRSGGRAGPLYEVRLEDQPQEGDGVFESHGVKIWVDSLSYSYVRGSEVDGTLDSQGELELQIRNPNAVDCDECGARFLVAPVQNPQPGPPDRPSNLGVRVLKGTGPENDAGSARNEEPDNQGAGTSDSSLGPLRVKLGLGSKGPDQDR